MNTLLQLLNQFVQFAYWYCVDFMVNLGNLTGTSYDEANTWVLLLLIPALLAGLIALRIGQWVALWRWRRR